MDSVNIGTVPHPRVGVGVYWVLSAFTVWAIDCSIQSSSVSVEIRGGLDLDFPANERSGKSPILAQHSAELCREGG